MNFGELILNEPLVKCFASTTPETDSETNYCDAIPDMPWVDVDVARRLERERDEARARVEIITPHENNPVAEYFSSPNTPETDAAVIASNGQWSFALKETCQRLERERDEALEALDCLLAVIGLTPIAGNKHALQEAVDNGLTVLRKQKEAAK